MNIDVEGLLIKKHCMQCRAERKDPWGYFQSEDTKAGLLKCILKYPLSILWKLQLVEYMTDQRQVSKMPVNAVLSISFPWLIWEQSTLGINGVSILGTPADTKVCGNLIHRSKSSPDLLAWREAPSCHVWKLSEAPGRLCTASPGLRKPNRGAGKALLVLRKTKSAIPSPPGGILRPGVAPWGLLGPQKASGKVGQVGPSTMNSKPAVSSIHSSEPPK